jgi:hypothetical protein
MEDLVCKKSVKYLKTDLLSFILKIEGKERKMVIDLIKEKDWALIT